MNKVPHFLRFFGACRLAADQIVFERFSFTKHILVKQKISFNLQLLHEADLNLKAIAVWLL